jgi:hypothetical protein
LLRVSARRSSSPRIVIRSAGDRVQERLCGRDGIAGERRR